MSNHQDSQADKWQTENNQDMSYLANIFHNSLPNHNGILAFIAMLFILSYKVEIPLCFMANKDFYAKSLMQILYIEEIGTHSQLNTKQDSVVV